MEEALGDRISFRRFVGLGLQDETPDHSTISRFRSALEREGLAVSVPDASEVAALSATGSTTETLSSLRWLTGTIGFAVAGLALVAAALRQWKAGGTMGRIDPASLLIGIGMQLTWVDAATIMHQITGIAFVIWMIAIGGMLLTGRVERHFSMMRKSS